MAKKLITLDVSPAGLCYIMIGNLGQAPYKLRRITFERLERLINSLGACKLADYRVDTFEYDRWQAIVETCRKVKCPCKS